MQSKVIGGILLIMGTSIGAGMLALPLANASNGFWYSLLYLCLGWSFMTLGAFYLLETNLYLKPGHNMVSMAHATLGTKGLLACWACYLLLLYTLLCAYIAGGTDVLSGLFKWTHLAVPDSVSCLLFTTSLGLVVFSGIRQVDLYNRVLMFVKFAVFLALIVLIAPAVNPEHLESQQLRLSIDNGMIILTSFGFAIIIPNLRDYFKHETALLVKIVLIGSFIPLLCYIAWDFVIMGTLPTTGSDGLLSISTLHHPTTGLSIALSKAIASPHTHHLFNVFTSVCMLTAFLGVALCLMSFLSDGLKIGTQGREGVLLFLLTFAPPLLINLFIPGLYLNALSYAGILCIFLLLLLPALMSYVGRRHFTADFYVPGGKRLQLATIMVSLALIAFAILPIRVG